MTQFAAVKTQGHADEAVGRLLADLVRAGVVEAVLAPARQEPGRVVMQTLITDPTCMGSVAPFAPVVWTHGAKLVSALTFKSRGEPVAAVLRSCEVRAFLELTKLKQGARDSLLLIGTDCLGRAENRDFLAHADAETPEGAASTAGLDITAACKACEYPVAPNVDLRLCQIGATASDDTLWVEAVTSKGVAALQALEMTLHEHGPEGRDSAIARLEGERRAFRDALFASFKAKTETMAALQEATAACINCYNCRVACPVCYCRECVFGTDVFRHDSEKYLHWASKWGQLRMPTDTVFYHLTRMVHMSTLCVGCGQCSSACPNGIPVMELFRTASEPVQERFGYRPGHDPDAPPPLSTFHESEFEDVTGQRK